MVTLPCVEILISFKGPEWLWLDVIPLRPGRHGLTVWIRKVWPGRPGWSPTQAPHGSRRARQTHLALHLMTSLRRSAGREPLGLEEDCNASPDEGTLSMSLHHLGGAETANASRSLVLSSRNSWRLWKFPIIP